MPYYEKQYPNAALHQQQLQAIAHSHAARPASSIYSQSSPIDATFPTASQQHPPSDQYQQLHSQYPRYHTNPPQPPLDEHQQSYSQHHLYQTYQQQPPWNEDGVSPPSSPELAPYHAERDLSVDVSPIDSPSLEFSMSSTTTTCTGTTTTMDGYPLSSRSNIPVMRERRQAQDAATRTVRETKSRERLQVQGRSNSNASSTRGYKGGEVRWDPRTGELTSSEKGRPGQVKPAEYARGLGKPGQAPTSPQEPPAHATKATAATGITDFANQLRRTMQGAGASVKANKGESDMKASPNTSAVEPTATPQHIKSPVRSSPQPSRLAQPKSPMAATDVTAPAPVSPVARSLSVSIDPAAGAFTSDRPAWQGASGRTTLVAPVYDTPDVRPLSIPPKSNERIAPSKRLADRAAKSGIVSSPPVSPSPLGDETLGRSTVRKAGPSPQEHPPLTPSSVTSSVPAASTSLAYPSPPLSGDPTYNQSLSLQQEQPRQLSTPPQIKRKAAPTHQNLASFDANDPSFSYSNKTNPQFVPSPSSPRPPAHDPSWAHSPSPFSAATDGPAVAASSHDSESDISGMSSTPDPLRSSPPIAAVVRRKMLPQLGGSSTITSPSPPLSYATPRTDKASLGSGVMDRQRPPCLGHSNPNSIKDGNGPIVISLGTPWMSKSYASHRDSVDSASSGAEEDTSTGSGYYQLRTKALKAAAGAQTRAERTVSMAGSVHKTLPPAPPETTAKDRVAMLNAQLTSLAQRRINIDRSIKQMTELMPTDNLLAAPEVLAKREGEKRKVEGLRTELSEIQREEYEIGLKLHRAYKRLDRNAEYEPTTLWVRRVTG